ncbi:unnamed protein product [Camellia sinensis]
MSIRTQHNISREMGDLHSLAYSSTLHHHSSSLGWDFHNLGVLNADNMSHFMEATPPFFSPLESDFSTGYLQDALFEFNERSKRRRLLVFADNGYKETNEPVKTEFQARQSYWDTNNTENCSENFSYQSQITSCYGVSGEPILREMKTPEEEISASEAFESSQSSHKDSVNTNYIPDKETLYSLDPISPSEVGEKRKKRVMTKRLVYPFALVKPGGIEGDVTLNDINERILMPPTRPVRHPVGDYACRPLVSPDGPGLSGKAVVAFTRIHTQGRGTITIIRTKG